MPVKLEDRSLSFRSPVTLTRPSRLISPVEFAASTMSPKKVGQALANAVASAAVLMVEVVAFEAFPQSAEEVSLVSFLLHVQGRANGELT